MARSAERRDFSSHGDREMFDRLTAELRKELLTFEESGMGYWRTRKLRDGRVVANVYINDRWEFGYSAETQFKLRDIVTIEWDGYRGATASSTRSK
jgi:hypothetical protein